MDTISSGRWLAATALACAAAPALGLDAVEVLEKVAPSVWAVRGLDAEQRPLTYGSAVVIGPGRLITNCHVLAKAKAIQVRRENVSYDAKLEHPDVERDLCSLTVAGFSAPTVAIGKPAGLTIGQQVYAIGEAETLEPTLSEGLVSGLRSEDPKLLPVQTTAAVSPSASGGGLFDEHARLVGILTLSPADGARLHRELNFAAPAEWIDEVPARAKLQVASYRPRAHAGGHVGRLPHIGAKWTYSFRDERYDGRLVLFTIRVTRVDGSEVHESMQVEGGASTRDVLYANDVRFMARRLYGDVSAMELAPYYFASDSGAPPAQGQQPTGYSAAKSFEVSEASVDRETLHVPAGSFEAVRVHVSGKTKDYMNQHFEMHDQNVPVRFDYTAWYAPEVNRYIMARHKTWNRFGGLIGDEVVQLLECKLN